MRIVPGKDENAEEGKEIILVLNKNVHTNFQRQGDQWFFKRNAKVKSTEKLHTVTASEQVLHYEHCRTHVFLRRVAWGEGGEG